MTALRIQRTGFDTLTLNVKNVFFAKGVKPYACRISNNLHSFRDVSSSLVAHLAANAANRVRIPASGQILNIKFNKWDGVRNTAWEQKEVFKNNPFQS